MDEARTRFHGYREGGAVSSLGNAPRNFPEWLISEG
jgi:hypothetical protein